MIYWLKLISSHKHIKKKEKRKDTRRIRLDPVTGFSQFESPLQQMSVSLLPAPGIAWLCCDARRQVRMQALTYLQRALLVHDLQTLDATEWESCFNKVRKEEKGHMSLLTIKSVPVHLQRRVDTVCSMVIDYREIFYSPFSDSVHLQFQNFGYTCAHFKVGNFSQVSGPCWCCVFVFAGAFPSVDKAAWQHKPSRCGWHGGDQNERLHTPVKGLKQHTLPTTHRYITY